MAIVRIPNQEKTITDFEEARAALAAIGIGYQVWKPAYDLEAGAENERILQAYAEEIEQLKQEGGYVTADVINVTPATPGLDAMLLKFSKEHWHDEDEVRFIIDGRGVFHIHPKAGDVVAIEVQAGDLIRVPQGTWHWFDLCADRNIKAIRLFQDPSGWTPRYTDSGVDAGYLPVCMGMSFIPTQLQSL